MQGAALPVASLEPTKPGQVSASGNAVGELKIEPELLGSRVLSTPEHEHVLSLSLHCWRYRPYKTLAPYSRGSLTGAISLILLATRPNQTPGPLSV
jgi:hypothetical protein